ncbi:MAG: hypothetical protein KKD29_00455 [Candidatus Omnitrophica bacterium]|nr:hypothetical protein [Candidatus Omnitrophota bacterium]MBU4487594.1 hypothetical protein [Candidatus Omnitrophota bacterium]MCG2705368.1 LPS assembly lipoprotein LptE [Candidatus Omnitrophota bacterium]
MAQKISFLLILTFCAFIFSGCGYSGRSLLPENLKSICVGNFKSTIAVGSEVTEDNKYAIYRPGIENDITNAIVDRFAFDGNLKIAQKDKANLVLEGTLTNYIKEALRYDNADNVEEYRIRIVLDMKLIERPSDKVMWTEKGFAGEATYNTMGRYATSEDTARDEAIKDLARRVVERTVEGW